jgi:hypothetical protein
MKKYFLILLLFFCQKALAQKGVDEGAIFNLIEESKVKNKAVQKSFVESYSRIALEVYFDDNYDNDDKKSENLDSGIRARIDNSLKFGSGISLNTNLLIDRFDNIDKTARRNSSVNSNRDRSFENIGISLRELNISKSTKDYSLIAGKFHLNFGSGWRWDRGIWMREIANSNYRQVEKLGAAAILHAGDLQKTGKYHLSLSSFTNDRKNLDNSTLSNRNSDNKASASAGDTRSLKSYAVMLDIDFDFGEREKLSYQFSYLNLAANARASNIEAGKIDNQKDLLLNVHYQYPINDNLLIDGLLEYVEVENLNGNSDIREKYFTANFITKIGDHWSVLLGNSRRQNIHLGANGFDQNISEASLGYEFKKNSIFDRLTIQAGYKNFRNDQRTVIEELNTVGFLIRYYKSF